MLLIKTLIIYKYIYIFFVAGVDPLKFGYIQSFKAIAAFWSHRCFAAMVKNSWPTGVTSWADTVKFAQLLFGSDVQFENYSHRLPHNSNESFLLFAPRGHAKNHVLLAAFGSSLRSS